jgi:plasmid maintenance system antidote protein VapI
MDPKYWLNLQIEYDIRLAKRTLHKDIAARVRVLEVSA